MDLEADGLGSGEGDESCLRVGDDGGAEAGALALAEVDYAVGEAGLFEEAHEARGDSGGVDRGLQDDRVAVTMEAAVIPAMMAKGKFQGGMTAPTPSGM